MKKLFTILLVLLNTHAFAAQNVGIVWPFNLGGAQATYSRLLIEAANKDQKDYVFILENKPGAGGTISVNHVINAPTTTLVSHSSSFFLRPIFYPNESYKIDNVRPVLAQAVNQPLAVISTRYSTLAELKQQKSLTIGIQNGGITEVVARTLKRELIGVELIFVPYNGTFDATHDLLADQIDLSVDMLRDIKQWIDLNKIQVIGLTGPRNIGNLKSFKSQGISSFDKIAQNWFIYTSAKTSDAEVQHLHNILSRANRSPDLIKFYKEDYSDPADLSLSETNRLFQTLKVYWPEQVRHLNIRQ
jgi:tripartite-type tricarboxylate transporter receptor subunit TctC